VYRIGCLEILPGQFALPNYFELFSVLRKLKKQNKKYDILNSHTRFFDNSWWGPLVAKYLGATSILTDHCASHPVHHNPIINFLVHILDTVISRIVPQLYDKVLVISKTTGSFLMAHGLKIRPDVIYAGVDEIFANNTKGSPSALTVPKGYQVVTFLGRMIPSKNPQALLTAAHKILETNQKVVFVFAGDGSEYDNLKNTGSNNIVFLGKISKQSAAALLQRTDILVHPSVHHEGLPITLLEAGISGCAVLASDAGATWEIIIDNKTGKIIAEITNIAPELSDLLSNKTLQETLGKNLKRKILDECNWPDSAQQYYSVLQNLT
jgi:glycosyltransferase involved in cell wall biosynthesis